MEFSMKTIHMDHSYGIHIMDALHMLSDIEVCASISSSYRFWIRWYDAEMLLLANDVGLSI